MNVTVERVENEATLKITAPAAEVNAGYKKAVQKIADQANIPGFRKGKAPRAIIEMHYGKEAVKQEAFEIVANKAYSEALNQEKLIPVSDPKVEESTFEEGKDMELTIKVTLKPEPELGEYKGLHVEKKEVEVTDEQVDAQIKDMMGRDAKMVVAEEGAVIEKVTSLSSTLQVLLTANRSAAVKAKAILWKLVPTPSSPASKISWLACLKAILLT